MIDEIIARLKGLSALKQVGGAADFQQAATANPKVTPCAFVYELEDNPSPSEVSNLVLQRVSASVAVMLVVRNVADSQGVAARQDLSALRQAVKETLLGWVPVAGHDPMERGPGALMLFKDSYMWWQDTYRTVYYDRSVL